MGAVRGAGMEKDAPGKRAQKFFTEVGEAGTLGKEGKSEVSLSQHILMGTSWEGETG